MGMFHFRKITEKRHVCYKPDRLDRSSVKDGCMETVNNNKVI